jgi:hypothetical protein
MYARINEDYRRHQLVAADTVRGFAGKAWKDGVCVFEAHGDSLSGVHASLKSGVDQLLTKRAGENTAPTVQAYVDALRSILPSLSDKHLKMLRAHSSAPDRSLTATQLAKAAGYANYNAVNLQYGLVGKLLWEELPTVLPTTPDCTPIFTFAIAEAGNRDAPEDQWVWQLRAEVAAAVKELGLR